MLNIKKVSILTSNKKDILNKEDKQQSNNIKNILKLNEKIITYDLLIKLFINYKIPVARETLNKLSEYTEFVLK